jgi:hypothetical protein
MMMDMPDPPQGWTLHQWRVALSYFADSLRRIVDDEHEQAEGGVAWWMVWDALSQRMVNPAYDGRLFLKIKRGRVLTLTEEVTVVPEHDAAALCAAWERAR